jgi:hypothetical protein
MSIPVELGELTEAMAVYRFGYLLSIADDGRPHVVAARPAVTGDTVTVTDLGRRTSANIAARPPVTLLFPPAEPAGYSLIVDGRGAADADGSVRITPERAVLHRPALGLADAPEPAVPGEPAPGCVSDCVEIELSPS